jgi:hypothetical protein
MPNAQVIVCERGGAWAIALRLAAAGTRLPLRETRSLAECRQALRAAPASLLAVECDAERLDEVFNLLVEVDHAFPWARVVVLAQRGLEEHEELARELGAEAFVTSPRDVPSIARLARGHLAAAPVEDVNLFDRFRARLPWGPVVEQPPIASAAPTTEGPIDAR